MIGTRLEHYEITAHLGSGGMGQVYQATDSRLGRSVAIKILPEVFAQDSDRVMRFEREARVLASLNHPHIAAIYGVGRSEGRTFLVMELVPGETLAERLAHSRTGLPLGESLVIARQIAEALQAAHQGGVIHRDLKPANIKITPDGAVKVLDFGLAKLGGKDGSGTDLSQSPTITNAGAMTEAGVILGTAAYMSPEQAKGHTVDKRSDVWAFGCILFEMLTGERLFEAADVSETLAAVLMREPDWHRLPANLPPTLLRGLRRCLERDRARRIADIAAVLFAMDVASEEAATATAASAPRARSRLAGAWWVAAALTAVASLAALGYLQQRSPTQAPAMLLQVGLPPIGDFSLAPDGRSMVFSATIDGKNRLWLRRFESSEDRALPGTDFGFMPFWKPDGLSLAFYSGGSLKRIDLSNSYVRTVAPVPGDPRVGSWSSNGTIIFSTAASPLYKVSAEGGTSAEQITELLPGQSSHRFAQFLPDGQRFLFLALGEPAVKGIYLGSLADKTVTRVMDGEPSFSFMGPNYLVVARDGGLWAQAIEMSSGKLQGSLLPIAPQILVDAQLNGLASFSTSASGALLYRRAPEIRQIAWVDRTGRETGALGEPDESQLFITGISADGGSAVLRQTVKGNTDVWLMDTTRGTRRRLTTEPAVDGAALFSPDGSRVVYSSDPKGTLWDLYERPTGVTGAPTALLANPGNETAYDWSPDGRYILYSSDGPKMEGDIWALPLFGERKPFPVAQTAAYESSGTFSPDGRWIAFFSDESGRAEVYAQPFPGPGPRIQLTVSGAATRVRWSRRSPELFYFGRAGEFISLPVTGRGTDLVVGAPRALFALAPGQQVVPSPDGQRFLTNKVVSPPPPLSIIVNWKPPQH